jgi:hypothetical protein
MSLINRLLLRLMGSKRALQYHLIESPLLVLVMATVGDTHSLTGYHSLWLYRAASHVFPTRQGGQCTDRMFVNTMMAALEAILYTDIRTSRPQVIYGNIQVRLIQCLPISRMRYELGRCQIHAVHGLYPKTCCPVILGNQGEPLYLLFQRKK